MDLRFLLALMVSGFLISTLGSCFSVKPSTSKGAGKDYEVFYLGDNRDQYFIKPLSFQAGQSTLLLDITFRHPSLGDSAIVNFTLNTDAPQARIRGFELHNELFSYQANSEPEVLFTTQTDRGEYQARYSLLMPAKHMDELLEETSWKVLVVTQSAKEEFIPSRSAQRTINRLVSQLGPKLNRTPVEFFTD